MLPRYPKVAELSKLTEKQGFRFNGENAVQQFAIDASGYSVSGTGDVNGDGLNDFIMGAPGASYNGYGSGQSYVVFGNNGTWNSTRILTLSNLDGRIGFILNGEATGDNCGYSVSGAGDVNGDGIGDLLIGAPSVNFETGRSYVVFGKLGLGSNEILNLGTLNGTNGFVLNGQQANDLSGSSVSGAGDVNNDGIDDLLIGAPHANSDAGRSYVVFGKLSLGSNGTLNLGTLNGTNGFVLNGEYADDQSGQSVSAAGDVNDDGVADLLIGAPYADFVGFNAAGRSYVVFGKSGIGDNGVFNLSTLNGTNGFVLKGPAGDYIGFSVSAAGDVNSDGVADLLIGTPFANSRIGCSYVVFGKSGLGANGVFNLSTLNGTNGFVLNGQAGDESGTSVSAAGDVNGDGVGDLLIGAPHANFLGGRSYVVFGKTGIGGNGTFNLGTLNGANGFVLNGEAGDESGSSVSFAGDVNGDSVSDFLIGAPFASPGSSSVTQFQSSSGAGSIYIITNATNLPPLFVTDAHFDNINQGEIQLFSSQNIQASDDWTLNNNLLFTISNLHQGHFIVAAQSVLSFTQGDVINEKVTFMHDGSDSAPSFDVSVFDGTLTTGPVPAKITFIPNPTSNATRNAVIAGVAGGLAGVVIFGTLFLRYRANKQLEETINRLGSERGGSPSSFQKTVLLPIAKAIFNHIKITGFMNYINEATTRAYVNAIQTVVEELQKQGVDLDIEKMSPEHQQSLFNEVSKQIRLHTLPKRDGCATAAATFCRFFKAEIAPIEIEDKANAIAVAVQKELSVRAPLLDHVSQQDGVEFSQKKSDKVTDATQTGLSGYTSPAPVESYSSKTPFSKEDDGETEKFIAALKISSYEKQKNDLPGDNPQTRLIM